MFYAVGLPASCLEQTLIGEISHRARARKTAGQINSERLGRRHRKSIGEAKLGAPSEEMMTCEVKATLEEVRSGFALTSSDGAAPRLRTKNLIVSRSSVRNVLDDQGREELRRTSCFSVASRHRKSEQLRNSRSFFSGRCVVPAGVGVCVVDSYHRKVCV